jgi:hypothetical protein
MGQVCAIELAGLSALGSTTALVLEIHYTYKFQVLKPEGWIVLLFKVPVLNQICDISRDDVLFYL